MNSLRKSIWDKTNQLSSCASYFGEEKFVLLYRQSQKYTLILFVLAWLGFKAEICMLYQIVWINLLQKDLYLIFTHWCNREIWFIRWFGFDIAYIRYSYVRQNGNQNTQNSQDSYS